MKYKLIAKLGGLELEEYRHASGATEAPAGTVAFLVNGCLVCVAHALLVKVEEEDLQVEKDLQVENERLRADLAEVHAEAARLRSKIDRIQRLLES